MAGLSYGWVGATTESAARFTVRTTGAASVRVLVSASADLANPVASSAQAPDGRGLSKHEVSGLAAATAYYWAVEADGAVLADQGRLRTLPVPGAQADFGFCFAGDRIRSSNHVVYDQIRSMNPLQFLFMGDIHYSDIDSADRTQYDAAFEDAYSTARYSRLLREVPTVATWDNHDFTGRFGWSGSVGAAAAQESMRAHGTFYPLPASGLYCTWVVGRCRFILLDTRTFRSNTTDAEGASKTMLGTEQKRWFLDLLQTCAEPVVFLCESIPHRMSAAGGDRWGDYQTEFAEINAFINAYGLGAKMVVLSADMHAIAADDGRNSRIGAVELVAAPLDQTSSGSGTWQIGPIVAPAGTGQFGHVQVTDAGDTIKVEFTGRDHTGQVLAQLAKTFDATGFRPEPDTTTKVWTDDDVWARPTVRVGASAQADVRVWQGDTWT
ncbi:PhoD-like phosphatase [Actinomadura rubteroloni]|uniref:PhoD-like phosphatase n=1 Tax=Actinomadura rubteroloni TaxID=1926885 RepID=A0A2P4UGA1_9ACTN|nr:alkaline phosphatase D family protein [Actinomadura rubteroloni]POM24081.1 PhoD-like phosphatase [Actinomadura rubteroloni]